MANFSPKDPSEGIFYGHDFTELLASGETISSAAASMRVLAGTDASASSMLSGSPVITGSVVKHKVIGGVAGNSYMFGIAATTSTGQVFIESGTIKVKEKD